MLHQNYVFVLVLYYALYRYTNNNYVPSYYFAIKKTENRTVLIFIRSYALSNK